MRKHPASFLKYIVCKPMIAMRWMLVMFFLKQRRKQHPILFIPIDRSLPRFPFVISGSVKAHKSTQEIYRIVFFEFFDDFVLFPLPVTYSLFAPTPSTQYPFFNRAISTSCLATMRRSLSISLKDLLACSAEYGLPLRDSSDSSPSSKYFFAHVDSRPLLTEYSFSICLSDSFSSK